MMFLLDTNIISEMVKKQPDSKVIRKIEQHCNSIHIAAPVWHELVFGFNRMPDSPRRGAIEFFLYQVVKRTVQILPYDEKAASWHAVERSRLSSKGLTPPFVDGQIASIACTNNGVLVTRNTKDYQSFSDLMLVNWFE